METWGLKKTNGNFIFSNNQSKLINALLNNCYKMTSNYVGGSKRKTSERPRSYAISSDNKKTRHDVEELIEHEFKKEENFISHCKNLDELWETSEKHSETAKELSKETSKETLNQNEINLIYFRLQSLSDSVRETKDHLDLINFFSKSNYDLIHSELTFALDNLEKIKKDNEMIKNDLINYYKYLLKKE